MNKRQLPVALLRREITWGIRYLLFQLVFLGSLLSTALSLIFPHVRSIHIDTAYFVVNFAAVVVIFHHYLGLSLKHGISHLGRLLLSVGLGFSVYYLMTTGLDALILWLNPEFQNINDASITQYTQEQFWLTFFGTVILVPTAEETLFRGLIFGALRQKSQVLAYVLSILIFAFIHIMGYFGTAPTSVLLLCLMQYIPAGLVLASAYEYSGSILAPILIHTAVNTIAILSMR